MRMTRDGAIKAALVAMLVLAAMSIVSRCTTSHAAERYHALCSAVLTASEAQAIVLEDGTESTGHSELAVASLVSMLRHCSTDPDRVEYAWMSLPASYSALTPSEPSRRALAGVLRRAIETMRATRDGEEGP